MECDGTTYPIVVETHDILPTSSKKGVYLGYSPDMDQSQHSITIMTVRRPVEERLRHKFMCHMKVYMLCGLATMVTWIYLAMTSSPRPGDIWSVLRHLYMYSMSMTVSLFILSALVSFMFHVAMNNIQFLSKESAAQLAELYLCE